MATRIGEIALGLKIDTSGLRSQIAQAGNSAGSAMKQSLGSEVSAAVKETAGGFTVLKGAISGVISAGIGKVVSAFTTGAKAGFNYSASLEQTTAAFETMTGSAAKAQSVVGTLKQMAAKTPFEMSDLTTAAQTLMQYGLSASDAVGGMKMLGDIAQGDAQRMNSLSLAYGQMTSLGKVQLQDLKQMIGAGFNPLNVISKQTGESMASLYDRISKGTLSVNEIKNAMISATSAGGQFYNGMARQSKTINGQLSTLKENAKALISSLMSPAITWFANTALPFLIKAIDAVQAKVNKLLGIKSSTSTTTLNKLTSAAGSASDTVSKSAKKASDAVKKSSQKAKRYLASFDEINNLTTDKASTNSSSNGSKKSGSSPATGATKAANEAGKEADKTKKKFNQMLEPIKNAWAKYGKGAVQAMKNGLNSIWGLLKAIGKSLMEVWLNGTGQKTVELLLQIWAVIWGIIGKIADKLKEAWEHNKTGTQIVQHLWNILNSILGIILKILNFVKEIISRLDFSPVLEAINSVLGLADQIFQIVDKTTGIVLNKLLKGDYRGAGKAFSDGLKEAIETVQKWIDNLDFSGIAKAINKALKNGLEWMKGLDISGIFGDLGKLVASVFNQIVDFLSKVNWDDVFQTLEKSFENLLNALFSFLGNFLSHVDWEKVFGTVWKILGNMIKTHSGRLILAFAGFKVGKGALSSLLKLNKSLSGVAKLMTKIGKAGSLSEALFGAGGTFANISTVLHGIGTALSTVGSALSGVFSSVIGFVSANPVTLIIAGIVAAVAVLVALYRHCKPFRDFVNWVARGAVKLLRGAFSAIGGFIHELWKRLKGIGKKAGKFVRKDWKEIILTMANPFAGLFALLYKHNKTFRKIVNGALKVVKGFFSGAWHGIKTFFSNIGSAISNLAKRIQKSAVGQFAGNVISFIGNSLESFLPHFATGAYVEANTPRLAIVGDNRHEGEFVAPEGKLKAAVQEAMAEERVYSAGNSATETAALLDVLYEILRVLKGKNLSIDGEKLSAAIERVKKRKALRTG